MPSNHEQWRDAFKIACTLLFLPLFYLVCLVGEVNFVEYLRCFVLDCFNFYMMRRKFPLSLSCSFLDPLETIQGDGMTSGVEEVGQLLHQALAAVEEASGQPQQLPASLITASNGIVCKLFHNLAVDLVSQYFLQRNNIKTMSRKPGLRRDQTTSLMMTNFLIGSNYGDPNVKITTCLFERS